MRRVATGRTGGVPGVDDLRQAGHLLYKTRGTTTVIGAGRKPGPLMRDGLSAAGYRHLAEPAQWHAPRYSDGPAGDLATRYR